MNAHSGAQRRRVAILGAGPAGLATALALVETGRFEVHVYQVGWRAGGKCATGRDAEDSRTRQNGSHYLFGCYHNAFALIRKAYRRLAESNDPDKERFGRLEEEFASRNLLVGAQAYQRAAKGAENQGPWYRYMPQNMAVPGEGGKFPTFFDYSFMLFQFSLGFSIDLFYLAFSSREGPDRFRGMRQCLHLFPLEPFDRTLHARVVRAVLRPVRAIVNGVWNVHCLVYRAARSVLTVLAPTPLHKEFRALTRRVGGASLALIRGVSSSLYRGSLQLSQRKSNALQRTFLLLDLGATLLVGYFRDGLGHPGSFERIDHYDFKSWLLRHGAHPHTVGSALITTWYDAVIAYEDGDKGKPTCSAGVVVLCMLRALLSYKGAFAYQMRAEVGDSYIAPIVKALEVSGVRFHFYSRVKHIVVSAADRRVQHVTLGVQCAGHGPAAEFVEVADHEFPLRPPRKAWPSAPLCPACKDVQPPLDSYYCQHEIEVRTIHARRDSGTLPEGAAVSDDPASDEAFDYLVAALPLGVMQDVLVEQDLSSVAARDSHWARCFDNIRHTESQALRMWFNVPLHPNSDRGSLGWEQDPPILSGYDWPHSTWEDNSQAIHIHNFPEDPPHAIATVFGPLATSKGTSIRERAHFDTQWQAAKAARDQFIDRSLLRLWPGLDLTPDVPLPEGDVKGQADLRINWNAFIDLKSRERRDRFEWQHMAVNVGPSESYVQAAPGTLRYRLRADESSYSNLFLAGDWTRTGIDVGCVEGAVIAGLKAARAVSGENVAIIGGDDFDFGTVLR